MERNTFPVISKAAVLNFVIVLKAVSALNIFLEVGEMDELNISKEVDDGMKQVDAAKKYGLSQSKIANFLKKRKQIEEAANSNEINPQRKR
ncbi:hypothetical protein AVEN_256919-1 [Araneus ventricosus]|uniref:HTH psq-type domain-containing protein n=1 Tax=Araneus ventricosus TaxID=182803 RepID=A0A4Y2CGQ0_ARAVE|nr:hypothetical protein AVEN_256919-1 [Araneus ventricosus]